MNKKTKLAKIMELAKDGLFTDAGDHKQWFLEEIFELAGGDMMEIAGEFEDGIAP